MKIGRLSLEIGGNSIVIEDIQIENIVDLKNVVEVLIQESKFASPRCYYQKVCTDFPNKCAECTQNPKGSHFSKVSMARVAVPSSSAVKTT